MGKIGINICIEGGFVIGIVNRFKKNHGRGRASLPDPRGEGIGNLKWIFIKKYATLSSVLQNTYIKTQPTKIK